MTSLRAFRPQDLFHTNLTNLDPLTENYNIDFYLQYLIQWPSLFTVVEDQYGNIAGYIMGKVEEDPSYMQFSEHYLPWHGHVTALTIAPQYRRLGLAKTLTGALERGCDEQNAWFIDLFVRKGNDIAVGLYRGLGYSVFRRVLKYYSDDPTGGKAGEDAFDMRKPLHRDKKLQHIRDNGENYVVHPEDLYHG
jgi:N-terminal acetyltransferase B complex catalytic subunit